MTLRLLVIAGFVLAVSSVAVADDKADKKKNKRPDFEAIFKKLDTNNDGKLSPAEFAKAAEEIRKKKDENQAAKKAGKAGKMSEALFKKLDTDKNGFLSLDEFKKMVEVMKEMKAKKDK